jgi:NAD(P)H dehydrogenase (quinone)
MRCLIVTAHPDGQSLNHHLGDLVTARLTRPGAEVTRFDLGQTGFDPAMTAPEWRSHFAQPFADEGLGDHIAALQSAEVLVLIAPIWWAGLPAQMKGWIDRVWAPGHAFDPQTTPGQITPLLVNLRQVVLITTHGGPWWIDWLVQRRPVQTMLRYSLLRLCARRTRLTSLSLYRAEGVTDQRLRAFVERINRAFARLS